MCKGLDEREERGEGIKLVLGKHVKQNGEKQSRMKNNRKL